MKIEVGMYIRSPKGRIEKINSLVIHDSNAMFPYTINCTARFRSDIAKASYDIIDLIEAGDYVNGRQVYQVGYNFRDDYVLKMSESNYEDFIHPNYIKSIVTHEQFEDIMYEVE